MIFFVFSLFYFRYQYAVDMMNKKISRMKSYHFKPISIIGKSPSKLKNSIRDIECDTVTDYLTLL